MHRVQELLVALQLQPVDAGSAYGEVQGCPFKLTILGDAPLSLLLGFFVGTRQQVLPALQSVPAADKVDVSLEDGFVWLTLFGVQATSGTELAESLKQLVIELQQAGFEFDDRCGVCGERNTKITLQESQPVRICELCLDSRSRQTEELNRAQVGHLLYLPLAMLGVAAGWTVMWVLMDLFIEWMNVGQANPVLELNQFTGMIMLGIGLVLFFLGTMMGKVLRFARTSTALAAALSAIVSIAATTLGEIAYIAVAVFRKFGVIDFGFAVDVLLPWLQAYDVAWVVIKLCVAACAFGGCYTAARQSVVAPLVQAT